MGIHDPFSYTARWDSVGLDCAYCKNFRGPKKWPDTARVSRCDKHGLPLTIELMDNGYKEGAWFCRAFVSNGKAFKKAVGEFESVRSQLMPHVLYSGHGEDGLLKEHTFDDVQRNAAQQGVAADRSSSPDKVGIRT